MSWTLKPKVLTKEDLKAKVLEEKDYIKCPKFNNSLNKYLAKSPEIVEDKAIARLLMINPEEVEKIYQEAVKKIKEDMEQDE